MDENNKDLEKDFGDKEVYEIGYHIVPTVAEENVALEASKVQSLILENGGAVISEELPQLRVLSYEIRKRVETKYSSFNKAYFGWIKFEIDRASIGAIKEGIDKNQNVLRSLIIKTVKENTMHTPKPPMMKRENEREEKREEETVEKREVSEAEIDKSIEELVIN